MITYRIYQSSDRDRILDFIRQSDNTDRTPATWDENPMTAVLALDGDELVGAVPFEQRNFEVGRGGTIPLLWVTAAHVSPEYRSKGVGSALLDFACSNAEGRFEGFGVYREDETSPAYRWYAKAGFRQLQPILAYRKQLLRRPNDDVTAEYSVVSTAEGAGSIAQELSECHKRSVGLTGGFPRREKSHWPRVFAAHYYRDLNAYSILFLRDSAGVRSFALLGRTAMRDGIDRFDILEFVSGPNDTGRLLVAIEDHATRSGVHEVRIQLAADEPLRAWIEANGYEYRNRGTFILGRLFRQRQFLERRWREIGVPSGLLIKNESAGSVQLGSAKESLALCSISDIALDDLAFRRRRPAELLSDGSIVCHRDADVCVRLLETMFPVSQWRYFQSDYI